MKRDDHTRETRRDDARGAVPESSPPRTRRPYRKPTVKTGELLERTTLESCLTGAGMCGPYAYAG